MIRIQNRRYHSFENRCRSKGVEGKKDARAFQEFPG